MSYPCACIATCGDVPEEEDNGVCKGLPRRPAQPLVEVVMVPRNAPLSAPDTATAHAELAEWAANEHATLGPSEVQLWVRSAMAELAQARQAADAEAHLADEYKAERDSERARADRLQQALARAVYLAEHLHAMVPREVWRDSGGDDQQGHYEGDYHAENIAAELEALAAAGGGHDRQETP